MERLEPELKQIVKRSTTQIADHAYQRGENLAQESQPRYTVVLYVDWEDEEDENPMVSSGRNNNPPEERGAPDQ